MAWPSWMPLAARPANWIDWSAIFRETMPREWPKRLFGAGSQAYQDLIAFGEAMALARDFASLLQHNIWPALDGNDFILNDRWEETFGLQPQGTQDERTSRLIAFMRQRGTMTQTLVKAIMARAWNSENPDVLTLVNVDPVDVAALGAIDDYQAAQLLSQMYIYHTAETVYPAVSLIIDFIAKNKPTFENWYYGQYFRGKYEGPPGGAGGGEGTYNHATYS